jgi:rhodanese-related sulfurtransferase
MISKLTSFFMFILLTSPLTFAAGKVSPTQVDGATTVSAAEAKALFDEGVIFVDVRSDKDFDAGRIPDALHLNSKTSFTEASLSEEIGKGDAAVLYCNGEGCMRSSNTSAIAVGWGFSKIYYFRDGYPAWKLAGYPVE